MIPLETAPMPVSPMNDRQLVSNGMTRPDYLRIFTNHLRVAEPKRSEIIAELTGHLDELPTEVHLIDSLGYPIDVALKYNRTHIGILDSRMAMLTLPWMVVIVVVAAFMPDGFPWLTGRLRLPAVASILLGQFALVGFFGTAALAGVSLRRTHRFGFALGGLLLSSLVAVTTVFVLTEYMQWRHDPTAGYLGALVGERSDTATPFAWGYNLWMAFGVSVMGNGLAVATALAAAFMVRPFYGLSKHRPVVKKSVEGFLTIMTGAIFWWLGAMLVGIVSSSFTSGLMRGSQYPWWIDLAMWLNGVGAYVVSMFFVVPFMVNRLWKRSMKPVTP